MGYEIGVKCGSDIRGEKLILSCEKLCASQLLLRFRLLVHQNPVPFSEGVAK